VQDRGKSVVTGPGTGPKECEERELLNRIAAGDQLAMNRFYALYQKRVFAFVLNRLKDGNESQEVVNDVMWEVWKSAGSFEGRSRISTWVFGIAYFKAVDRLRKRKAVETIELVPDSLQDDGPDAVSAVFSEEVSQAVAKAMGDLSPEQRALVHLAFFEDLSYGEIAEIVACPVGTVKSRMSRVRSILSGALATLRETNP